MIPILENENSTSTTENKETNFEVNGRMTDANQSLHRMGIHIVEFLRNVTDCKILHNRKLFYNLISVLVLILMIKFFI